MSQEYTTSSRATQILIEDQRRAEAARRAAELKRLGVANQRITQLNTQFDNMINNLDAAKARLPDLDIATPKPSTFDGDANNVNSVEAYANTLQVQLANAQASVDAAIKVAEKILTDRLALANAHQTMKELATELVVINHSSQLLAESTQEDFQHFSIEELTDKADLPHAQKAVAKARDTVTKARKQLQQLTEIQQHQAKLKTLAGDQVDAVSAQAAHATWLAQQQAERKRLVDETLQNAFAQTIIPEHIQSIANIAIESEADVLPWLKDAILRHQATQGWRASAEAMLQKVPVGVGEVAQVTDRWTVFKQKLCSFLQDGTSQNINSLEREHAQLLSEAQNFLSTRFAFTELLQKREEQGFKVSATDTPGMILLEAPNGAFVEVHYEETEYGTLNMAYEVFTDDPNKSNDLGAVDDICAKLGDANTDKVTTQGQVLERARKLPVKAKPKHLYQVRG